MIMLTDDVAVRVISLYTLPTVLIFFYVVGTVKDMLINL